MLTSKVIAQVDVPGTLVLAAATAGRQVFLKRIVVSMVAAGTLQFQDTDGTALSGIMPLGAGQPLVFGLSDVSSVDGWIVTAPGKGLQIVSVTHGANGIAQFSQ